MRRRRFSLGNKFTIIDVFLVMLYCLTLGSTMVEARSPMTFQTLPRLFQYGIGYEGVDGYATAPSNSFNSGWAAIPIVTTNANYFIEAGAIKDCDDYPCYLMPYSSWQKINGIRREFDDTGHSLTPGTNYRYYTSHDGAYNTMWQAVWCHPSCQQLALQDLGTASPTGYVAAGAESSGAPFGTSTLTNLIYKKGGTNQFYYWCYNDTWGDPSHRSACNNYSWSVWS